MYAQAGRTGRAFGRYSRLGRTGLGQGDDCNPGKFPHGTVQADVLPGGLPNEVWDSNAYGGCGGWVQYGQLFPSTSGPELGPAGSWAPSVAFDSPGLSSEELRAIMEAPDYVSPTVPGLNQPSTPGYVYDPATGQAVPGYETTFTRDGVILQSSAPGETVQAPGDWRGEAGGQGGGATAGGGEVVGPGNPPGADVGGGDFLDIAEEGPGMRAGASPLWALGILGALLVAGRRRRGR